MNRVPLNVYRVTTNNKKKQAVCFTRDAARVAVKEMRAAYPQSDVAVVCYTISHMETRTHV